MVEVVPSRSRDSDCPISDESSDLETPLQVWRRLFAVDRPSAIALNSMVAARIGSLDSDDASAMRKPATKRRARRRLSSRDVIEDGSSSDNNAVGTRTLRSRKIVTSSARRRNSRKVSTGIEDSPDIGEVKRKATARKLRRAKPTRRSTRNKSKKRKAPLEFVEFDSLSPDSSTANDMTSPVEQQATDVDLDDSQKTVLLDTPDVLDCYEIADEKLEEIPESPPSPAVHAVDHNDDIPHLKNPPDVTDSDSTHDELSGSKVNDDVPSIPDEAGTSRRRSSSPATTSCVDDRAAFLEEFETTDLDDIFFKPHAKKPPPGRNEKSAAAIYTTPESTCSSLLEDDTLWATK